MLVRLLMRAVAICSTALLITACRGAAGLGGQSSAEEVHRGAMLYRVHGCTVCHGSSGRGDGPAAQTLNPKPRDFRDLASYRQGTGSQDIAETLRTGVFRGVRHQMPAHELMPEEGQMPAYLHLNREDRLAIAAFVVSLRGSQE